MPTLQVWGIPLLKVLMRPSAEKLLKVLMHLDGDPVLKQVYTHTHGDRISLSFANTLELAHLPIHLFLMHAPRSRV